MSRESLLRPLAPAARRWLRLGALQLGAVLLLGAVVGVGVAAVIHIPSVEALKDFSPGLITEVHARDGATFRSYARERRMLLEEGEIPDVLRDALLAAEDKNFYEHGGLDLAAILRSSMIDLTSGEYRTGASTITMQLARTYFGLSREKLWRRKIQEALLAVELEKRLSKEQILTLYANIINLGEGRYGVKAATRHYFDKEVADLTVSEAATLAAIIPAPSVLSPYRKPEAVERGRNEILGRMLRQGVISRQQHDAAVAAPLDLVERRRTPGAGRYFAEEVRRYLENEYGVDSLYERGLRVHTTLDLEMQRAAERALRDGLSGIDRAKGWRNETGRVETAELSQASLPSWSETPPQPGEWHRGIVLEVGARRAEVRIGENRYWLEREGAEWTGRSDLRRLLEAGDVAWFEVLADGAEPGAEDSDAPAVVGRVALRQEPEMEAALVMIESATGAVRALVGGWDFGRSQFNRVTQGRRQVGSAFKPFVFGAALEAGYTPADTLFDGPVVFPGADQVLSYSPRNYKREYQGIITLRRALEHSINVTSTKLLDLVGAERVIDFARRCGITSDLPPYPSLALGTADLIPLEVATAYATLGNHGVRLEPYMIERITTRDGRVLEEHLPRAVEAVQPEVAFVITHMLRGVVQRGTGASAAALGIDIAGKTGTTDSYSDAWFVGYTPRYTLLVWVGYDQKRFLGRGLTGAAAALPTWRAMVEAGISEGWLGDDESFTAPAGVTFRRVEYATGLLAGPEATRSIEEAFLAGTEPVQVYDRSWAKVVDLPWYQQRPFYGVPKLGERMPEDVEDWTLVRRRWDDKKAEPAG